MHHRVVCSIATLALFVPIAAATAQSSPPHVLAVVDQDSHQPIAGAEVRDSASGKSALTNAAGTVNLAFITPLRAGLALAAITVRKVGYKPLTLFVPIAGDTTNAEMQPTAPTELPTVVTSEHYRLDTDPGQWAGFGIRCQSRLVSCVDSTTLADRPSYRLHDFLIKQDGILPTCGVSTGRRSSSSTPGCLAQMRPAVPGGPRLCTPTYFVDGIQWTPMSGSAQAEVDQAFGYGQAKGIEVYLASQPRPIRFTGDPNCGAIVIWTK